MTDVVEKTPEELAAQAALEAEEGAKGLQAGFEKVRGKYAESNPGAANADDTATPTAEETAAKKAEEEAAAKAAAEAAEKAWLESAPASVRQSLEIVGKLPDRLRNIEGHIGGLKSALQTATEAAKAARASGAEAPTQAQIEAAATSTEKMRQLREDFPDIADALAEGLAAHAGKAVDVEGLKKEVVGELDTRFTATVDEAEERAYVRMKHPRWKAEVNTPEFKAWFEKQPDDLKAKASSRSGDDAVEMLDAFKRDKEAAAKAAAAQAKTTRRLEAAIAPKGSGAAPVPQNNDANAFRNGWNRARGVKA